MKTPCCGRSICTECVKVLAIAYMEQCTKKRIIVKAMRCPSCTNYFSAVEGNTGQYLPSPGSVDEQVIRCMQRYWTSMEVPTKEVTEWLQSVGNETQYEPCSVSHIIENDTETEMAVKKLLETYEVPIEANEMMLPEHEELTITPLKLNKLKPQLESYVPKGGRTSPAIVAPSFYDEYNEFEYILFGNEDKNSPISHNSMMELNIENIAQVERDLELLDRIMLK